MNGFNKELGTFIKINRKKKNLSTSELANKLNISSSKLNNIENALNDCFQINLMIDIAKILEVDIFDFIFKSFKELESNNIFQLQLIANKLFKLKTSMSEEHFELIVDKILSDLTVFESISKSRN